MTATTQPMHAVGRTIEDHPKLIVGVLFAVMLFFALACGLNDVIPVCHYPFRCDHRFGH
ncbi:MAG: hypothetical protein ACR2N9_06555 [Acidimicrobiia bacterium]